MSITSVNRDSLGGDAVWYGASESRLASRMLRFAEWFGRAHIHATSARAVYLTHELPIS